MRTIAMINRKGGCGKTATTVSLAARSANAARRTLVIDLDPQGSASSWLGPGPTDGRELFETFLGTQSLIDLGRPSRAAGSTSSRPRRGSSPPSARSRSTSR